MNYNYIIGLVGSIAVLSAVFTFFWLLYHLTPENHVKTQYKQQLGFKTKKISRLHPDDKEVNRFPEKESEAIGAVNR